MSILSIVIPLAGKGSRFTEAGYKDPKPFIDVAGKRMIERVIENLTPQRPHRFIFIAQAEHLELYNGRQILTDATKGNCVIIPIESITQGAACTVLLAKDIINNANPLMIANSDQYLDIDINKYLELVDQQYKAGHDASIMTMNRTESKWSFVLRNRLGKVSRVIEKQPVSDEATIGVYNWKAGSEFVRAAETMILKNLRHNNEFYVAPAFNELISDGGLVGTVLIPKDKFLALGTPSDLEESLKSPIFKPISS